MAKLTFADQVKNFVAKTHKTADEFTRELLLLVMSRVDQRSPIGDPKFWKSPAPPGYQPGLFRGSWMLGVDTIDPSRPNTRDPNRKMISVALTSCLRILVQAVTRATMPTSRAV